MADGARVVFKNDKELRNAFKKLSDRMPDAAEKAMRMSTLFLQAQVQEKKLSGQVLKVKSGRLRSSINTKVRKLGPLSVIGVVGTNVVYARIHEFGGIIRPRNADALYFRIGDRFIRSQKVTIPKRPFLRPAFSENTQRVKEIFKRTIVDFSKQTLGESKK